MGYNLRVSKELKNKKYQQNFETVYKNLNPAQKKAVDTIDGPVLVIAGPGTGKTQVLTARIANILLKTDTPSRAVLALTFTDSGVKAMRERLLSFIGSEAYYVSIYTFHSFCSDVIKDNPDKFVIAEDLEPLSELERVQIFREILDEGSPASPFEVLRPFGSRYYYVRALVKNIQDLKREGISPEEFSGVLKGLDPSTGLRFNPVGAKDFEEKDLKKNLELVEAYKMYQKKLVEKSRYDFEDMINLVVEAFGKDENLLRKYQEKFQYILLDEFQDTNTPQNKVVRQLASYWGEEANVFAVGDDEQSIYRFQGASIENILFFRNLYPKAQVITLSQNYRSRQNILDASREVINNNDVRLDKLIKGINRQLVSVASPDPEKGKICVGHFSSGVTESFFVGHKIKELIEKGVPPAKIAIIYRHNSDSADFADTLSRLKIPYDLSAGQDILKDHDLEKLLKLLGVILKIRRKDEDLDLFTLFNYEFISRQFSISSLDVLKLARFSSDRKVNFVEAILHPDFSKGSIVGNPHSFTKFVESLLGWQKDSANETFVGLFEKVVDESGFLNWVLSRPDGVEKLNRLNSLFNEAKKLNYFDHQLNLERFFEDLKVLRESNIAINETDLDIKTDAVALTTAHGAKGLEFDFVFIVKCLDGKFGNNKVRELIKLPPNLLSTVEDGLIGSGPQRGPETGDPNEDERRLFYVALTRARHGVFISFADSYFSDAVSRDALPSMFLAEIGEDKKTSLEVGNYEKGVREILKQILAPLSTDVPTLAEKDFLSSVLLDFKLSVTALNTYLECPYKFKLNTLFRTPRAKDKSLCFGSAVHRGLEMFLRKFKEQGFLPPTQYLIDQFEAALAKEILTPADYRDVVNNGRKILKAYVDFYKDNLIKPIFTEKFFGYGFSAVYLEDIPLTGKVDRIDPLNSENYPGVGRPVRVVDYKTGKPRSRNEIEGKTKKADSGYKRQLIFYKLLADLDQAFNFEVVEAELDFVEGREGNFVKHSFVISKEEVEDLKKIIKDTMGKIRNLVFPRTENYDVCSYCDFKHHCWPEGVPKKNGQQELPV